MHPLRFSNSGIRAKGRPPVGATARKGRPPTGAAANDALARDSYRRLARKRLPTAHPQGAAASKGGSAGRRGGCPLAGRLPTTTHSVTACVGAATTTMAQEGEGEG
ncbi:hypothetical protein BHE74_00031336 [Ensete ventricosum]|nr:hypothetical protein BHE74_00031336 [Ensete ventricosum]RZS12377.1 hypothetical protein BHM03_00043828 [Ensete ventricosum]